MLLDSVYLIWTYEFEIYHLRILQRIVQPLPRKLVISWDPTPGDPPTHSDVQGEYIKSIAPLALNHPDGYIHNFNRGYAARSIPILRFI